MVLSGREGVYTCFPKTPFGVTITPALLTRTSSLSSFSRNSLAAGAMVVRSSWRNSRRPVDVGWADLRAAMAVAALEGLRLAM
jgi:hypothetical protein